jgi:hypothetical protein
MTRFGGFFVVSILFSDSQTNPVLESWFPNPEFHEIFEVGF